MFAHVFAQRLQQGRVLGEALHQDLARAVQRPFGVEHARVVAILAGERRAQVLGRLFFRIDGRIGQQIVGQRRQARLDRDLGLGAALLLVWQVQVFQPGLVLGVGERVQQGRGHLVLVGDRRDDRGAALFQFAQVAQALFEQAQLDVVEAAGGFLAVARDERHGGAFVQQGDGGDDLHRSGGKFDGEALFDSREHGYILVSRGWNDTQSGRMRQS